MKSVKGFVAGLRDEHSQVRQASSDERQITLSLLSIETLIISRRNSVPNVSHGSDCDCTVFLGPANPDFFASGISGKLCQASTISHRDWSLTPSKQLTNCVLSKQNAPLLYHFNCAPYTAGRLDVVKIIYHGGWRSTTQGRS